MAPVKHAAGFARPEEDEYHEVIATKAVADPKRRAGFTWHSAQGKLFVPFGVLVPGGRYDPLHVAHVRDTLVAQRDEGDIFTAEEAGPPALPDGVELVGAS